MDCAALIRGVDAGGRCAQCVCLHRGAGFHVPAKRATLRLGLQIGMADSQCAGRPCAGMERIK